MHVAAATIGIDSPTGAALVSLSAIVGPAVVAEGETPAAAVQIVMLVFTAAALASGALLYCIGVFRRERTAGSSPISSSADFSQLPGWLLAVGSIRMATGIAPALEPAGLAWTWICDQARNLSPPGAKKEDDEGASVLLDRTESATSTGRRA